MRKNGYSLLELLITLLILGVLLSLAFPSFQQQIQRTRLLTETDLLQQGILFARTNAISLNQRVTMAHKGSWASGWDIFVDANNNGRLDEGERIILTQSKELIARIHTSSPVDNYVSFTGTGQSHWATGRANGGFQAGTFTICMEETKSTQLILARGGRVRLVKESSETC